MPSLHTLRQLALSLNAACVMSCSILSPIQTVANNWLQPQLLIRTSLSVSLSRPIFLSFHIVQGEAFNNMSWRTKLRQVLSCKSRKLARQVELPHWIVYSCRAAAEHNPPAPLCLIPMDLEKTGRVCPAAGKVCFPLVWANLALGRNLKWLRSSPSKQCCTNLDITGIWLQTGSSRLNCETMIVLQSDFYFLKNKQLGPHDDNNGFWN